MITIITDDSNENLLMLCNVAQHGICWTSSVCQCTAHSCMPFKQINTSNKQTHHQSCHLTKAIPSIVCASPECTMSFSDAPCKPQSNGELFTPSMFKLQQNTKAIHVNN